VCVVFWGVSTTFFEPLAWSIFWQQHPCTEIYFTQRWSKYKYLVFMYEDPSRSSITKRNYVYYSKVSTTIKQ